MMTMIMATGEGEWGVVRGVGEMKLLPNLYEMVLKCVVGSDEMKWEMLAKWNEI